ncbi:hypothetical protein RQP46_003340 [Phenoliferia psychrophenolica]
MSQGSPPVAAHATAASIASLAPQTLAQILIFAAINKKRDIQLQALHEEVCHKTLRRITRVCKLWRSVAAPLHFQTPQFEFDPSKPCQDLVPFQLDPSLAPQVRSVKLLVDHGDFWETRKTRRTQDDEEESEPDPQIEGYRPLTEWMVTLKNLAYLYIDLPQFASELYAAWPVDAFPNVKALHVVSVGDSFFNQALVSRMPNLKALYLSSDGYSGFDSSAQHLIASSALPNSRCLTTLFLTKCDISPVEVDDLAHALGVAPGIKRLQWLNERRDQTNRTILPLSPSLLRALSKSHITHLDIHPWPTSDVLEALPDTIVKLEIGTIPCYPGNQQGWTSRGEPEFKRVLEDTITAVLDARVAGRFPNMKSIEDMLNDFRKLDAVFKERAEQVGLKIV